MTSLRPYVFFLAFVSLFLHGCALTVDTIQIEHTPSTANRVDGASNVHVAVQVQDNRADKSRVSVKKNMYAMELAPIVAAEDVALTIQRAVQSELRVRGFQIASASNAQVHIDADVTRFYNDHVFTSMFAFWGNSYADLHMNVQVRSKTGQVLYQNEIKAKGLEPRIQLQDGNNARKALNDALRNGMQELFADDAFIRAMFQISR